MLILLLVIGVLIGSIVSSDGVLANDPKPAASKPVPAATDKEDKSEAPKATPSTETNKPKATEAPSKNAPLVLHLSTRKDVFTRNNDIFITAQLWATQPVTLCLYPKQPMANFSVEVYRGGYGKLNATPPVVQLTPKDQVKQISLKPGQKHQLSFNLKRLVPIPAVMWKTGEYQVNAKFFLCQQTEQAEQEVAAESPVRFMVLE